jgi:hypothetical protein
MAIYENLKTFQGKTVVDFDSAKPLADPQKVAYRIRLDWDEGESGTKWADKFADFLKQPDAKKIESLVVGAWEEVTTGSESGPIVEALAAAGDYLLRLKHLFFGDITMEESEISWIKQSDLSPILHAYPQLEHLTIRGGQDLSLGSIRHARLRELIIQSGGLAPDVVRQVVSADLPALEHLELWLGEPNYGGDATVQDLAPLLQGNKFARLKYLGLEDSVIADEIAKAVVHSPILKRLEVLDISMGALGDEGASALIACAEIGRLKKLDIHRHYISPELIKKLESIGIEVDASDAQGPAGPDDRYIAVGE